jgi:hypothetical protein
VKGFRVAFEGVTRGESAPKLPMIMRPGYRRACTFVKFSARARNTSRVLGAALA